MKLWQDDDDELIENAKRFTNENRDIVNNISRKNLTVARGLAILVVGFIFTSILFFITIGVTKWREIRNLLRD